MVEIDNAATKRMRPVHQEEDAQGNKKQSGRKVAVKGPENEQREEAAIAPIREAWPTTEEAAGGGGGRARKGNYLGNQMRGCEEKKSRAGKARKEGCRGEQEKKIR